MLGSYISPKCLPVRGKCWQEIFAKVHSKLELTTLPHGLLVSVALLISLFVLCTSQTDTYSLSGAHALDAGPERNRVDTCHRHQ
jgi:hypothetical protein